MLFIEIDGVSYPMKAQTFRTQKGKEGIRIFSDEAPLAQDGFKIVNGNGDVISDKSDFKYLYRETSNCREYTTKPEEIIPTESHYEETGTSVSPYSVLAQQISAVSAQVSAITPYTESKTAYIDDTEVRFDITKEGNIFVFMVDGDGQNVPFTFEQVNGQIIVSFEKRDSLATVTISIQ